MLTKSMLTKENLSKTNNASNTNIKASPTASVTTSNSNRSSVSATSNPTYKIDLPRFNDGSYKNNFVKYDKGFFSKTKIIPPSCESIQNNNSIINNILNYIGNEMINNNKYSGFIRDTKANQIKYIIYAKDDLLNSKHIDGFFIGTCSYTTNNDDLYKTRNATKYSSKFQDFLKNNSEVNITFTDLWNNNIKITTTMSLNINDKEDQGEYTIATNKMHKPIQNGRFISNYNYDKTEKWLLYALTDDCKNAIENPMKGGRSKSLRKSKKYSRKNIRTHKSRKNRN